MDLKKVFRKISDKLLNDFEISTEIKHNGSKGDMRENSLKKFLQEGRFPSKYDIRSGEIVTPQNNTTRQCDLIIYDRLEGVPLIYDESTQVYPIDTIYAVVEVKSKLSKDKLIEALENIKSIKSIVPNDTIINKKTPFMQIAYKRQLPGGFIFAYSLSGNSLDSLEKNLREWEAQNPPEYWPNFIIVLNEGVIYHMDKSFNKCYFNQNIHKNTYATRMHHEKDSFFYFYSVLLDLINNTHLVPPSLSVYFDLPKKMGKYNVKKHDRFIRINKGKDKKKDDKVRQLKYQFIDKIVVWCRKQGKMTLKELIIQQFGTIPHGMPKNQLDYLVYLYDPDNLPGLKLDQSFIKKDENGYPVFQEKSIANAIYIIVDDEDYYIPMFYIQKDDFEIIRGKSKEDIF